MPTTSEIIQISQICQYLAADKESEQNLFDGRFIRKGLARLIYIVRNTVQWLNDYNASDSSLIGKAIYLYSLCQPFVGQALQILGSGGSGTIINPATGVVSTIVAQTVEFVVGDPGALMNNGDTSLILNYTSVLNASVSVVLDGTPLPINLNDRVSFVPIYTTPSVTINFNQAAVTGQVYVIMLLQYVSV